MQVKKANVEANRQFQGTIPASLTGPLGSSTFVLRIASCADAHTSTDF